MKLTRMAVAIAAAAALLQAQTPSEAGMLSTSGTNTYVRVPNVPTLVPATGTITIEAWFLTSSGSGGRTILRKGSDPSYLMRLNGGTSINAYIRVNGSWHSVSANVPNVLGAWHHMAATYDGSAIRIFLDGVQVTAFFITGVLTDGGEELKIGTGANSGEQWIGSIEEVRLWSVARTQSQIQADRFRELGPEPGLVSAWRMNGSFADSVGPHQGIPINNPVLSLSTSPVVGNYVLAPAVTAVGAPILFNVTSGEVGSAYLFDVSLGGSVPGVFVPPPIGVTIPLNQPWLNVDLGYAVPSGMIVNFLGFVPPGFHAFPVLNVPYLPSLVGLTLTSSFVTIDPSDPAFVTRVAPPRTTLLSLEAPSITSVTPATSPQSGGATLTISGNHFVAGATVQVGGSAATGVVVSPPSTITATTPPGPLGLANVVVTNPDTQSAVAFDALQYVPNLVVGAVAPLVASGTSATIAGVGFQQGVQVFVGGVAAPTTAVSPSSVTFTIPPAVACGTTILVINPDLQSGTVPWNPAPVITQTINAQGSSGGGGLFFVLGTFAPGTTVSVGGAAAAIVGATPTAILASAPAGVPGVATVTVASAAGCTATTNYTYQ